MFLIPLSLNLAQQWCCEIQSAVILQAYTAIYSLLGIVQGMGFSYLSAVLSTIEKQFGIRSKVCREKIPPNINGPELCVTGDSLGVLWKRDQSNLFHLCSSLPQQDPQTNPLDSGCHDVCSLWSFPLCQPLLC